MSGEGFTGCPRMHLLICIPSYNEYVHAKLMLTLMNFNWCNIQYTISLKTGSLISRIRNEYISDFIYDDKYTHLLFIDNDLYDFQETLKLMLLSGKKMIGGVYRKKTNVEEYNVNLLHSIENSINQPYCEVKHIATGLLLIHRTIIEEMIVNYPETRYIHNDKAYFDLFKCFVSNERYLSEDYGFCELYRNLGGKIYCVLNSEITHNGIMNYRGNFQQYLNKLLFKK